MTRLESIRNNAFLLDLNMTRATKEQKIQWLCQIIDNETDKPADEIDFALIDECSAYLRELSDKAAEATKEQKRRILQQIKAHHNQIATTKSAKVLRPSWKTPRKIIAIAATIVLLLALTLTVIAKVNGYSNAWEYIRENAKAFFNMSPGSKVKDGEITLTKHDGVVTYNSIEELLQEEGYDIMYPSKLPEGVQLAKILEQVVSEERTVYCYMFNDQSIFITATTTHSILEEDLQEYPQIGSVHKGGYLVKEEKEDYQVILHDGKYEYLIRCYDYDVLIEILNGMKGLQK